MYFALKINILDATTVRQTTICLMATVTVNSQLLTLCHLA